MSRPKNETLSSEQKVTHCTGKIETQMEVGDLFILIRTILQDRDLTLNLTMLSASVWSFVSER